MHRERGRHEEKIFGAILARRHFRRIPQGRRLLLYIQDAAKLLTETNDEQVVNFVTRAGAD